MPVLAKLKYEKTLRLKNPVDVPCVCRSGCGVIVADVVPTEAVDDDVKLSGMEAAMKSGDGVAMKRKGLRLWKSLSCRKEPRSTIGAVDVLLFNVDAMYRMHSPSEKREAIRSIEASDVEHGVGSADDACCEQPRYHRGRTRTALIGHRMPISSIVAALSQP